MAGISKKPNAKGQWVVQLRFQGQRYQFPFRSQEDARVHFELVSQEEAKSRAQGKPTPVLSLLIAGKLSQKRAPRTTKVDPKKVYEQFEIFKKPDIQESSLQQYKAAWDAFHSLMAVDDLNAVSEETIQEFKLRCVEERNYQAPTINNKIRHLRAVFKWAEDKRLIKRTPFTTRIKWLKPDKEKKPFLYPEEVTALIKEAMKVGWDITFFIALGCYQGMRRREIQAAQWGWISNLDKILSSTPRTVDAATAELRFWQKEHGRLVDKGFVKDLVREQKASGSIVIQKGREFRVKNRESREVPLHTKLVDLIRAHPGPKDPDAYIIQPEKVTWTNYMRYEYVATLKKVLRAAKLETVQRGSAPQPVTPHVFRYTFVTLMRASKNPSYSTWQLARMTGHKEEEILDHYSHLVLKDSEGLNF